MTDDDKDKEAPASDEQAPEEVDDDQNHWRHMMYKPTDGDKEAWKDAGVPPDGDIVGGFLMNNPLVWGVPDKAEIFRLADTVEPHGWDPQVDYKNVMRLRYCDAPFAYWYELSHPHLTGMGDMMEHNYVVRLQAVSKEMVLTRIKVLQGSREDNSQKMVFEGTEYPGPAGQRQIRMVRITVHEVNHDGSGVTYATYEFIGDTIYPEALF